MSDLKILHGNNVEYSSDVETALNDFEQALLKRYEEEIRGSGIPWNPESDSSVLPPDYGNKEQNYPRWAKAIVADVQAAIPRYDTQDLGFLEPWGFTQLKIAADLLDADQTTDDELSGIFGHADAINDSHEWFGVAGDAFRRNFAQSAVDTTINQRNIAASLHNLYADRMALIESVRRGVVASLRTATEKLGATVDNSEATMWAWTIASFGATAVGIPSGGVGAALSLAVASGAALAYYHPETEYAEDIESVVTGVKASLEEARTLAINAGFDWSRKIAKLQDDIAGTDSSKLELYDLASGGGTGEPAPGFQSDPAVIEKLAVHCFKAAEEYEQVMSAVSKTPQTDPCLNGENDAETPGVAEFKKTRDVFLSFLQTTSARYYDAGERLKKAAEMYLNIEMKNTDILRIISEGLDFDGEPPWTPNGTGGAVEQHVGTTEVPADWDDPAA